MSFGRLHGEIRVTLRSPFLFKGLASAGHGFDASALRDEAGHLIIPGDHLRGHLRHALEVIASDGMLKDLFGYASLGSKGAKAQPEPDEVDREAQRQDEPARGALLLGDLRGPLADRVAIYHRVALDDVTGAAKEGSIQLIELPAPIGASVTFTGRFVLRPRKGQDTAAMRALLNDALQLIPAVGALKSVGFGEIISAQCAVLSPPGSQAAFPAGDRWDLTVSFDRPLLVDSEMVDSNIFRGRTVVPGAAIKGALAEMLADAGNAIQESSAFSALRVSHAFPLAEGRLADRAVPDALAQADKAWCLAPDDDALAHLAGVAPPAFPGDWKGSQYDRARKALGRPSSELEHVSRGRVRIDPNGVAEDGALFVVQPVATYGHLWRFTLDAKSCGGSLLQDIKTALLAGVDGVGRTGARMAVTEITDASLSPSPGPGRELVMLETPAILTDPDDDTALFDQYRAAFEHLAGAKLLRCWARQRMAGHYYAYRFRAFGAGRYQPFELTEAGAVFELEVHDPDRLAKLMRDGLPAQMRPGEALTWRQCPFVPENGYGALSWITDLLPQFQPETQDA